MKEFAALHPHFLHGADYNPDQWFSYPEILAQDPEMMAEAHCNCMSVGIFAWAMLEPKEGEYHFEELDRIIENLASKGIKTILATPSAARPRWMAEKYPEVRRVNKAGVREEYNSRHNHCYTSPVYREKTAAIDRMLAQRYGRNPNVILWHISNELGGECHCELCQAAFRQWLKKKYNHDLKALNHAWWSDFWSHTVTDWEQIQSPKLHGEPDEIMTGLYLDWRNFVTYQTTDFMKMEIEALREGGSDIPVTTNMMWLPQLVNYHYLKDYLDVVSWDAYPTWHEPDQIRCAVDTAFNHSYFRSLKHKPFLLMESTPSNTNWQAVSKLKRPGMHRLASLQAVAHGSDSVQYFQWRKGRGGSEKFHGAVIDHNGKASGRVFEDVKQVGISLEKLDEICGTKTDTKVAILYDHKNSWAISNASGFVNADKQYVKTCLQHYKSFWKRGVDVDVIETGEDLSRYSLVVMPMLYSMDQAQIDRIERYVAQGGTAVATYATGYVNETDLCYLGGFPGNQLKNVFGLTADEIDSLYPTDKNTALWDGETYDVVDYCELITPTTAEALGFYGKDFYKGMPALLKNSYKAGKAYYIGCRDTGALTDKLYAMLLQELNIKTYDLPEGVTVSSREKYLFVQNFNEYAVTVNLPGTYRNLESGEIYTGTIALNPLDIAVVCPENPCVE